MAQKYLYLYDFIYKKLCPNTMQLYHALNGTDWMLINNLKVGNGVIFSASFTGLSGATTKYQAFNNQRDKEYIFESIRRTEFLSCPSRMGALFCFTNEHDANQANEKWWDNSRKIVKAELRQNNAIGIFDSKQLDATAAEWESAARRYFSGAQTENPFLEVVINGMIYIHGWENIVKEFDSQTTKPKAHLKNLMKLFFK